MQKDFEIVTDYLFKDYENIISISSLEKFQHLIESELSVEAFSFYTSVSAVFSSKIEGENIDLDSYVKYKRFGVQFLPDYTRKIDDLYDAYQFAKASACNKQNIELAHALLTKHLLAESSRGRIRNSKMYVTTEDGRIEYVAASPYSVLSEMERFYHDLNILSRMKLSIREVFFYASLLHLIFVKIHPFEDGNGRLARLIEKWFLAEKLGEKAWFIQSEKNYYLNHKTYYKNIRLLGLEYETLDYSKALPFLLMLPSSLNFTQINNTM